MPIDALVQRAPDVETLRAFFTAPERRAGGLIVRGGEAGANVPVPRGDVIEKQPARYVLIQDEAALEGWIARARDQGYVGLAVATTGTKFDNTLVGIALALGDGDAAYVPLG